MDITARHLRVLVGQYHEESTPGGKMNQTITVTVIFQKRLKSIQFETFLTRFQRERVRFSSHNRKNQVAQTGANRSRTLSQRRPGTFPGTNRCEGQMPRTIASKEA
ncbi:hypothetical protein DFH28DRAFT_1106469 [Melampsora americana]|nr:hypothetical protein DFH28DRAFT_1106469 [Melampsora americana]